MAQRIADRDDPGSGFFEQLRGGRRMRDVSTLDQEIMPPLISAGHAAMPRFRTGDLSAQTRTRRAERWPPA